jgi:hypothetical protein
MDKKTLITAGRALYGDRWQTSLAHRPDYEGIYSGFFQNEK